ncbi:unnamed protein product [Nyctereutes procyonoides]|uniref:(raccoon dog) hypothetical protein n=1 Tax=Nyctereutes procyonoides TaxID=34880 RepID=A0A811Y6E6_NYCPR|nr:unnamed protein product [Nyctereutes procyonoides]
MNLKMLNPKLSFTILSRLNTTDLCFASWVWQHLEKDELFWQGTLNWDKSLRHYLDDRGEKKFLPNALRFFFSSDSGPQSSGEYLETLPRKFHHRFCASTQVPLLCYCLILFSIDLTSPNAKNKMSQNLF